MHIHIFGHSICARAGWKHDKPEPDLFVDRLIKKYNIPDSNYHAVNQGSEERILYFLKKVKQIDLAIIFHGTPQHFFCPAWSSDFHLVDQDKYWENDYPKDLYYMPEILKDKPKEPIHDIVLDKKNYQKSYENFVKHFYTPELNRNRHYGALIQIDQYLHHKKIHAIHCVLKNTLPTWFKFSNGIVDTELAELQKQNSKFYTGSQNSGNLISEEGNIYITNKLTEYIEQLTGWGPRIRT